LKKQKIKAAFFILTVLFFIFAGCTIITLEMYSQAFGRIDGMIEGEFTTYFTWSEIDQNRYSREEVRFNSHGNRLQGFIYGRSNNKGLVIISHGLGGSADHYLPMIKFFVDNGWRVFAYNNTGTAGSEGEGVRGLTQSVIDLDSALTFVSNSQMFAGLPVMLVGHSWGGFAVCAVLNFDHNVNAVVSFAGFNNSREIFTEVGAALIGGVFYTLRPQLWAIERQLFGNKTRLTAVDGINRSGIPVMIVQTDDDDIVPHDTTSIFAHRHRITNPNVVIVFREGEDATGHEFPFGSIAQRDYMRTARASWEAFSAKIENVTNADFAQWAKEFNFDKSRANELDPALMRRINTFFINSK